MIVITSPSDLCTYLKRQSRRFLEAVIAGVFLDLAASQRSSVASLTSAGSFASLTFHSSVSSSAVICLFFVCSAVHRLIPPPAETRTNCYVPCEPPSLSGRPLLGDRIANCAACDIFWERCHRHTVYIFGITAKCRRLSSPHSPTNQVNQSEDKLYK